MAILLSSIKQSTSVNAAVRVITSRGRIVHKTEFLSHVASVYIEFDIKET